MKKLFALAIAAITCLTVTACAGNEKPSASGTGKQPSAAAVTKAVSEQLSFQDELMTLESNLVPNFYSLKMDKLEDYSILVSSSGGTAEEVSVFKVKDEADMGMVTTAIEERIQEQKNAYQNYMPAEMPKIENAAVYTSGKYAILVMADDTSKVEKLFYEQL